MTRPLSFRIYDLVTESTAGAPDLSLLEMSARFDVSYVNVRATISKMERRGIIRRIYRGVYRLPAKDQLHSRAIPLVSA